MLKNILLRSLLAISFLILGNQLGMAQTYEKIQLFCERGGETVTTDGRQSTTKVQRSFPSCSVTVYVGGSLTLASIASNDSGTPKSNPFTADSDGYISFYALDGVYDVKMSGGGLLTPITRSGFWVVTSSGGGGGGITGSGTASRFPIFTSSSAIGNSVFQQVGTSEFAPAATGKRINLGTESQQVVEIANAAVGGTVQNRLAILTGAPSTAVTAAITDTSKIVGIVIANAGTSGNAEIVQNGNADCEFDGATTAGNYVGASTTLAGRCKDLGSSLPTTGVQVIGRVLETIGSAGNALVYTFTGEQHTSGLGGSGTTNYMSYWTSSSTLAASNLLYDISGQILQSGYSFDIQNGGLSELTLETDQVIIKGGVNRATSAHVVQVKGVAGQTGDYFKAIDSTSSTKFRIRSTGQPSFGGVNYTFPALPATTSCLQISSAGVLSTVSCTSGGVRQAINIQQAPYSCVGDGVTDDTACFQSALNDAAAAGGKLVYAPAATYKVTGLTVKGGVTLEGDGKFKTIIYSVTNATILDLVTGVGDYAFLGPKIKDLWVKGSNTGSSQIGIKVDDPSAFRDVVIENVTISNAGSYGLYRGNVFSSEFRNIYSTGNSNYNFFILSPNMPTNYDYGHYSGDISAAAPAGYRIKQGTFTCWSCNGINTVAGATGYWAVIGGIAGDIDGDVSSYYATASFVDCNIEGAKTAGILNYPGSIPSFKGLTTFVGLSASSGSYIAIDYDTDAALTPENSQRGYIEDTVIFSNSPASFYANSQPIHADGTPPVSVNGRGPKIAGAAFYDTFYNSATSRTEKLNRVDGYAPVIDITTSTSYTAPGGRAYRTNCAAPCTLTLPSPNFYDKGNEIITVFNISASGVNVTIAANGGAGVNGSTYVMSIQGQAVQLYPDFTSLDWRVVANTIGAGSTNYYALFDSAHTITQSGSLIQNSSSNLVFGGTTLYGTDNTIDIGSSGDNRPRHVYVGTDVISPTFYNVSGGACYKSGSASPEGSVTCEPGSIYLRTNGSWYIKSSGSSNTGWTLVSAASSSSNLAQAINVKLDYGCAGDGVTNDTSCVANALAAAVASTGKALYFPNGTYLVDTGTITLATNGVVIYGDAPGKSVIQARNGTSGLITIDASAVNPHSIVIRDLTLQGFGSGASNNGITISGANTPFNLQFQNLRITGFTGRGIYDTSGMFQSRIENVVITMASTGNNAFDLIGSNDLVLINNYVTTVANSTAAYRIHSGRPTLIGNNGVNPGSTNGSWGVFGNVTAEDGSDSYVFALLNGNNIEDFTQYGLRFKTGSYGSFYGNTMLAPSSGTVTPIKMDFVDNGQRGIWDATNSINTAGASYTNSDPINSRGAPFIQLGGNSFTTYYDTNIGSSMSFPYTSPQLVAGSTNIAMLTTRAQITALESSGLVGDLTGSNSFAGDAARVLLQDGTAARPTYTWASDTNTGFYRAGADITGIASNGAVVGTFGTSGLTLGAASSVTGVLNLANSSSAFLTTIQAGNAAAARTYTWPTNFGAAGTVLTDAAGNGTLSWTAPTAALTNTYVGYGASSVLTGTSDFTYATSTKTLTITNGSGASSIFLTGSSDTSKVNFGAGSVPGNQGGIVFPFVGGGITTGPGVWWCSSASYASCSGLFINNGLTYQGTNSTHDHFKLAVGTGTSSSGTNVWDWAPTSSLLTQTLSTSATGTAHVGNAVTLTSTGTAAANFGYSQTYTFENGSGSNVAATSIINSWAVATAGAETGQILFNTNLAGAGVGQAFAISGSQYYGTYATANITGAATINFNNGNSQTLTLTGNVTATTLTGLQSGGLYFLIFKQDGTGGWTLASSNIKVSGADLTITGTATTGRTLFTCMSDGTSLYCTKTLDIR